jgi:Zinc finger C-x8-C-x5-C-x3-H type (and similar)
MSSDSSLSTGIPDSIFRERLTHNIPGNASWDLADGIARLNINNGFDSAENIHGPIRTPPKPKKASETVVQLHESSPLESSDTSLDSRPSPPSSDERLALINHSRVSSADTTASTQLSGSSHTLASSALGLKVGSEQRDRPHSYSGGLSTADLQRLRGVGASPPDGERVQWSAAVDRQSQYDQPLYPSLSGYPRQQQVPVAEDLQVDYATQQRQFQPIDGSIPSPQAFNARTGGSLNGATAYRSQPARGYNPVPVTNGTYPGPPGHTAHLSLGNAQQVYDMMMSSHENPAVTRVQQQHNVFRGTHQHSSSDPLHLREAAALLSSGLPPFTQTGLYPPTLPPSMGIYPNQFYPPHEAYTNAGVAAQVMAAARLQSQFTPYGVGVPGQSISPGLGDGSQGVDPGSNGPSANNRKLGLYKTELCRSWEEKGSCRYGPKCQFAHGEEEIRKVARHPKVVPLHACC